MLLRPAYSLALDLVVNMFPSINCVKRKRRSTVVFTILHHRNQLQVLKSINSKCKLSCPICEGTLQFTQVARLTLYYATILGRIKVRTLIKGKMLK